MKKSIILIFIALLLNFNAFSQTKGGVPDFKVNDIYGNSHQLYQDYLNEGKYVFIDFFSVTCGYCQTLSPIVDTVYREYACNCSDLIFLGINTRIDEDDELVRQFTNDFSMSFPAISGKSGGKTIADNFGVGYVPYKLLIAPDGSIIFEEPVIDSAQDLRDTIQNLGLGFTPAQCEGNSMLYFTVNNGDDKIRGTIDRENFTVTVNVPSSFDLSNVNPIFTSSSNSEVKVNGVEQVSGETINDFSGGSLIYDITSEKGVSQNWTVTLNAASKTMIYNDLIKIFPNPTSGIIQLKIEVSDIDLSYIITDIYCKKIQADYIKDRLVSIDMTGKKGIYFLNIKGKSINLTKKIILY